MNKEIAKSGTVAFPYEQASIASHQSIASKAHKAIALCVGILLSLLAYTLHPESRLLVIAISVFTIIFAFMLLFWLVRLLSSVDHRELQAVKQEAERMSDLGA